jgi:hypothetical protein
VPRSIKGGTESSERVASLIQQLGEFRYEGVQRFEELDPREQRRWLTFTTSLAKAEGSFSNFMEVLERAVEQEVGADLRMLEAEIEDIAARRKSSEKAATRNEKRAQARDEEEKERERALFEVEIADLDQALEERKACHEQDLVERETQRKVQRTRDVVLMGITVFCVLLSAGLIIVGVAEDKPLVVGGSTVSAAVAITGFVKMFFFGWGAASPSQDHAGSVWPEA